MFRPLFSVSFAIVAILVEPVGVIDAEPLAPKKEVADSRLQAAKAARQTVESKEKAVAKSVDQLLTQLETAIKKIPSKTLEQEQLALDQLKKIAAALREQSEGILRQREAYSRDYKSLQEALTAAPSAFRKAGDAFREYAEKEPFEDIKAAYLVLAESWERLADQTAERANADAGPTVDEWEASCRYIASIAMFASRLEEHLDAFPDADLANRHRKHSEELKQLILQFEELKRLLRQFNVQLTNQALTSDLGRKNTEEEPVSPAKLVPVKEPTSPAPRVTPSPTPMSRPTAYPVAHPRAPSSQSRTAVPARHTTSETPFNSNEFLPNDPLANTTQNRQTSSPPPQHQTSRSQPHTYQIPAWHAGYYR